MDDHWPYSPFNRNLLETPNQHTSTIRLPLNLICHCKMSNQTENRLRSIRWTQQNRWQWDNHWQQQQRQRPRANVTSFNNIEDCKMIVSIINTIENGQMDWETSFLIYTKRQIVYFLSDLRPGVMAESLIGSDRFQLMNGIDSNNGNIGGTLRPTRRQPNH